ncbi:MAG TPA: hypothetical protein VIC08_14375 [Cellvibrionaceae bacterium]
MSHKTPLSHIVFLAIVALLIILGSVGTTLHLKGVNFTDFGEKVGEALGMDYAHATLTDARLVCEQEAHKRLPGRISRLQVDTRSSRRDDAENLYKVFMQADVYADSDREGVARPMFINCFTSTDRAAVTTFELAGDGVESDTPDGTNHFGL